MKIKSSQNAEITLSFTDICKSCPSREFLVSQDAICENKILVKISGFTVIMTKNTMNPELDTYCLHYKVHQQMTMQLTFVTQDTPFNQICMKYKPTKYVKIFTYSMHLP